MKRQFISMDLQLVIYTQKRGRKIKGEILNAFLQGPAKAVFDPLRFRNPHSEIRNASGGLYTDGEFDDEGCPFGFVVPYPDISVVIRDDGIDNRQS
jgi:hypothetical protein